MEKKDNSSKKTNRTRSKCILFDIANSSFPLDCYHHHFLCWLFSCQELFAPNFVHFIWGVSLKAKAPLSHEVLTMNAYGISITQYNQRHPHTYIHTFIYIFRREIENAQCPKNILYANFAIFFSLSSLALKHFNSCFLTALDAPIQRK